MIVKVEDIYLYLQQGIKGITLTVWWDTNAGQKSTIGSELVMKPSQIVHTILNFAEGHLMQLSKQRERLEATKMKTRN